MDELNTQTTETSEAPVQAPVADTPASDNGNATGLDLNALNQELSSLGNYQVRSAEDVRNIIAASQKGMREAQEKAAKHEQRMRRVEPLLTEAESNPDFQRGLYEWANSYQGPSGTQMDPNVSQVLNPVFTKIDSLEARLAERDMQDQMDALARDPRIGSDLTTDMKAELLIEARASGNYDLNSHFWRKYGPSLVDRARSGAKQEVVQEIQKNANAYPQGASPQSGAAAVQAPKSPSAMTQAEKDAYIQQEAHRILSDTRYRDKVLANR
jgi:hypothetical protein